MRTAVVAILLSLMVSDTSAQQRKQLKKTVRPHVGSGVVAAPAPEVFMYVEQQADFYSGSAGLDKYLDNSLYYPEQAKEAEVEGIVYVRFKIDEAGAITDVRLIRGIGFGCDEEALRVVKAMPAWRPAKLNGRPVSSIFMLPVAFKLK